MVRDSVNLIKDVHVVNLNSEKGTFSSDYGQYRIVVSVGDTLEFTSVQYQTIRKVITDRIAYSKKLNLILERKTYVLDEIVVKKHDLTGNLLTDRRKVSKDSIAKAVKSMEELILEIAAKEREGEPKNFDPTTKGLSDISTKSTDPTKSFKGIGSVFGLGSGNKKKKRIREITSDTFSTKNLVEDVGVDFFKELKISENNIYSFIDYCKQFNIKELYQEKKILDIIQLLKEKSTSYLKASKKQ
jgi:hypothetical protein